MHVVKLNERTMVGGICFLPGSQVEFANIGQANSFIYRNGGEHVSGTKRAKKNATKAGGSTTKGGESGGSKADASAEPDGLDS